jgi:hypothetical protein
MSTRWYCEHGGLNLGRHAPGLTYHDIYRCTYEYLTTSNSYKMIMYNSEDLREAICLGMIMQVYIDRRVVSVFFLVRKNTSGNRDNRFSEIPVRFAKIFQTNL